MICRHTALLLLSAVIALPHIGGAQTTPQTQKAVLVTGASSGLGRKTTEKLASSSYFVYAGVAIIAPLIEVSESDMEFIFNVNVYGPYRITKAFAPMLLESRGRVVNISSISGILSGAMLGPYSMTKHAVEAYGDALANELGRFGVRVSLIEPGNYKSDIGLNVLARVPDIDATVKGSRFEAQLRNSFAAMRSYETGVEPDSVAAAAHHAISSDAPRMRYTVVPAANQALATIRKAMDELIQLNAGAPIQLRSRNSYSDDG